MLVDLIRSEAAKAPIKVHKLRGNVTVLEGSGGNVAFAHWSGRQAPGENVATLKKQGYSLAGPIAAKPTAAHDAKSCQFLIDPAFFTQLVYEGV